jgi:predicted ATPase
VAVARRDSLWLAPELADGAAFVDLAPVADPALVPFAIAQALGVLQSDEHLDDALARHLGDRSLLLLVDNFEQVAAAAGTLAALAAAAPRLLVLTTSRLPLRVSGEHEYPVPPLPLPTGGAAFEEVVASDAVRLFLARAQAVDPGFALTDENLEAVVAICRGLDGLPLAIELAAARIRQLPPAQIALRLDRALELLTHGPRDLPERQQTLRAALDWSYRLLPEPEQALLARLAVFAGSFSLDAVEAVVADETDPLEGLTTLVDGSLVRRVDAPAGAARFALLETIRAYVSSVCARPAKPTSTPGGTQPTTATPQRRRMRRSSATAMTARSRRWTSSETTCVERSPGLRGSERSRSRPASRSPSAGTG